MKVFDLKDSVIKSLEGFVIANPSITLLPKEKFLFRNTDKNKIAIISGGGSGHEPTHAGFIGHGMLAGVVCGEIFSSPSTKQILNSIKLISQSCSGVLIIVKNYTGDVLNFGLATERAKLLGINCKVVVVGDDVAVGRTKGNLVGRRALAGTVLVHKITGSFIEAYPDKYDLEDVAKVSQIVNENIVTIGSSLDHCRVPGRIAKTTLHDNQLELGMGIHNEPGVQILDPIPSTEDLIKKYMLPKLLDPNDKNRYFVEFNNGNDDVVLLINNLGGVSNFMLSAIATQTTEFLRTEYSIEPVQTIVGTLTTAFDGNGFSITLLNSSKCSIKLRETFPEIHSVLDLLNAYTDAPAWPLKHVINSIKSQVNVSIKDDVKIKLCGRYDFQLFSSIMKSAKEHIITQEPYITSLDCEVGDGDCGYTLVAGISEVVDNLDNLSKNYLSEALSQVSDYIETAMGGTSGGIYSILVSGLSYGVSKCCKDKDMVITPKLFAKALEISLEGLYKYTKARPGASTIIDALEPFVKEFSLSNDFHKALKEADKGAQNTATLEARFGRASYVNNSLHILDPGAVGFVEFLKGVSKVLDKK